MLKIALLAVCLTFAHAGAADLKSIDESSENSTKEATDTKEGRHKGCQEMCEEDGEDPLDCEQYCVQVA